MITASHTTVAEIVARGPKAQRRLDLWLALAVTSCVAAAVIGFMALRKVWPPDEARLRPSTVSGMVLPP